MFVSAAYVCTHEHRQENVCVGKTAVPRCLRFSFRAPWSVRQLSPPPRTLIIHTSSIIHRRIFVWHFNLCYVLLLISDILLSVKENKVSPMPELLILHTHLNLMRVQKVLIEWITLIYPACWRHITMSLEIIAPYGCRRFLCSVSCCGVVVSMPVLQAGDSGSYPGSSETFTSYFGSVICVSWWGRSETGRGPAEDAEG